MHLTNNSNGWNLQIGDDAIIGDINWANTVNIRGLQDSNQAYIAFASKGSLGVNGDSILRWMGNKIWHEGNDGAGSGLDADLLDGLDSSRFHRSALSVFSGGDWNTLTSHGVYKIQHASFASDTNNPPASYPYGPSDPRQHRQRQT